MEALAAQDILKIQPHQARVLFPGSAEDVRSTFRKLARMWHPDTGKGVNPDVFPHIVLLHRKAMDLLAEKTRYECFTSIEGKTFRLDYLARTETENSTILVGRNVIAHIVQQDLKDLCARSDALDLPFASRAMSDEMHRFLPRLKQRVSLKDGSTLYVEAKRPDEILLSDLLKTGAFDPRHVAWIITRLLNVCCWLEWAGISHAGITAKGILVSPQMHGAALTGPFLTHALVGDKYTALSSEALNEKPSLLVENISDVSLDLKMVRTVARQALGGLFLPSDLPAPFAQWLMFPPAETARLDFIGWEKARDASFGAPRFIKWEIDPIAIMSI